MSKPFQVLAALCIAWAADHTTASATRLPSLHGQCVGDAANPRALATFAAAKKHLIGELV